MSDGKVDLDQIDVTAKVKDSSGNETPEATESLKIDTKVPGDTDGDGETDTAPVLSIPEAQDDGFVNAEELEDGLQTSVTIPEGTEDGDTVTLTIKDADGKEIGTVTETVSQAEIDAGSKDIVIPADKFDKDGKYDVTAKITDEAGNSSDDSNTVGFDVDTDAPATPGNGGTTEVTVDDITEDNVINAKEAGEDSIPVTGKVTGEFTEGDKVTVNVNGQEHEGTVKADGSYEINVPTEDLLQDPDTKLEVTVEPADEAGNAGSITVEKDYGVDTQAPDANTTQITVNDITDDNIITAKEAGEDSIPVTGQVTGDFTKGDEVTITVNDKPYTGNVDADGNFSIDVAGSDLAADSDSTVDATVKATDAAGNVGEISTTKEYVVAATEIKNLTLTDDLTDDFGSDVIGKENPEIADKYYPNQDATLFEGEIGSGLGESTTDLESGLTNDSTPTLSFSLDKPIVDGQEVVVTRYTVVDGVEGAGEVVKPVVDDSGLNYTYIEAQLPETYGTDYVYRVELKTSGVVDSSVDHQFRLDTIVESLDVLYVNSEQAIPEIVLDGSGVSEGSTITFTYPDARGDRQTGTATLNEDGNFSLKMPNWNRYDVSGVEITTIDAAGNVSTQKFNAIRNLFTEYSTGFGVDPSNKTAFDDGVATSDAGNDQSRNVISAEEGGLVATDGNDTLIIGLDNFGGYGLLNGSMGDNIGVINGRKFKVDTGAGDDFVQVRGDLQSFDGGTFEMGTGNDKLVVDQALVVGNYKFDMSEGNNIIKLNGGSVAATSSTFNFGSGHDSFEVSGNFDGNNTVNLGDGDNTVTINNTFYNGDVITGKDQDVVVVGGTMGTGGTLGARPSIDTGAGDDIIVLKDTVYRTDINAGDGNDVISLESDIYNLDGGNNGRINLGLGDSDTVNLNGADIDYYARHFKNVDVFDMTNDSAQTLEVRISDLLGDDKTDLFIKGDSSDTVQLGTRNDDLYDNSLGLGKADRGNWGKIDSKEVDGINYDVYAFKSETGTTTEELVYIQDTLPVI